MRDNSKRRGIRVEPAWKKFISFISDVGTRPSTDHTLSRIDLDVGYVRGNVAWLTETQRFWAKVDRSGDCWVWKGLLDEHGYGMFTHTRTHRVAWELEKGPIPVGMLVCHHCDNPPCVRPSHLFLGTQKNNMQDMHAKERAGKRVRGAKLRAEQVREIRSRYAAVEPAARRSRVRGRTPVVTTKSLAAEYGISSMMISDIVTRKNWKHVP